MGLSDFVIFAENFAKRSRIFYLNGLFDFFGHFFRYLNSIKSIAISVIYGPVSTPTYVLQLWVAQ